MTEFQETLDAMPLPVGEPFIGETLVADGWVYRDIPGRLSFQMWDHLLEVIGKNNYRILIMSKGPDWIRGQLMISPTGMENMKKYSDANK
jgi:hypothetical protein